MKKLVLIAMLPLALSCSKSSDLNVTPVTSAPTGLAKTTGGNGNGNGGSGPVSSTSFQLTSFTVAKNGNNIKVSWSAVGETNIISYDIERESNLSAGNWFYRSTVASSNNNALISRTFSDPINISGWGSVTISYRLKIYHSNNTVSYGPIKSIVVNTGKFIMWA